MYPQEMIKTLKICSGKFPEEIHSCAGCPACQLCEKEGLNAVLATAARILESDHKIVSAFLGE